MGVAFDYASDIYVCLGLGFVALALPPPPHTDSLFAQKPKSETERIKKV